jgi:glycosyltransferase involved in cell wall biosynthesis
MLVSIIIPAFNSALTISDTLNSILAQSYINWEALVIDDGSTDDLENFIKRFTDPRIKYFYKENGGVASARNFGIKNAGGDYIAFLDSDDIWHSDKLRESINVLIDEKSDLVYTDILMFVNDFNKSFKYKYCEPFDISNDYYRLLVYDYVPTLTVVVKSSVLDDIGKFDENLNGTEDWDLWIRIAKSYKFSYINRELSFYRSSSSGLSKANRDRHLIEELKVIKKHVFNDSVNNSIRKQALWVWTRKVFYNHIKLRRYLSAINSFCKMIYLIPFKKENLFLN